MNTTKNFDQLLSSFTIEIGTPVTSATNENINSLAFVITNLDLKTCSGTFSAHKNNKIWLSKNYKQLKLDIIYCVFCDAECYESVEDLDDYYESFCEGMKLSQAIKSYQSSKEASAFFSNCSQALQECFQDY